MCNGMPCPLEDSTGACTVRNRIPAYAACQRPDEEPLYGSFSRDDDVKADVRMLVRALGNGKAATAVTVTA